MTGLERLQRHGLGAGGWRENLAKAYGNAHGFKANKGAWIMDEYGKSTGCQGWWAFYRKYYGRIWRQVLYAESIEGPVPAVVWREMALGRM